MAAEDLAAHPRAPGVVSGVIDAIGTSSAAETVARAQEVAYGPLIAWLKTSPFHTARLGHSIHPPLTDLVIGSSVSVTVLDLFGGTTARPAAQLLNTVGFVAVAPTAMSGASDWAYLTGPTRRIGAVHAAGTDLAALLLGLSLVLRRQHRYAAAARLALAANLMLAGAGLLGGHLALVHGTGRRSG